MLLPDGVLFRYVLPHGRSVSLLSPRTARHRHFFFFNGHHLRVCTVQETPRVYSISLRFWAEPADATQNLRVCILQETPRVYSISLRFWAEPADATQREQGHDG